MSQRILRDKNSLKPEFHAIFAGLCGVCGRPFGPGTVITWSIRGYRHAACPASPN